MKAATHRSRRAALWLPGLVGALGIAVGVVAFAGCDRLEASREHNRTENGHLEVGGATGRPVDAELLAFLSKARAAHHKADIAEKAGNLGAAIEHVSTIVDGPIPTVTPEVAEVLSDAYARRAGLLARVERFDDASFDIERGLGFAQDVSYFRGHLYEVLGNVEEARAGALSAEGDERGGEAAAGDALDAYEEAIRIQDEVIQRALEPAAQ